jgi:hypothetical protein
MRFGIGTGLRPFRGLKIARIAKRSELNQIDRAANAPSTEEAMRRLGAEKERKEDQ